MVVSTSPGLAIHGKAFRLSKAALLIGCADRATCVLADCACRPWRNFGGFDQPRPCHPWQGVQAFKSCAFDRLRRPAFTHPWRGHGGFDQPLSRHPCRAVHPATEHSSVALGLRTKLRFVNACPRPLKSVAFHRLRRPGNLRSGGLCVPSLAQLWRLRPTPVSTSLSSRSALEKLRFSSAAPTGQLAFWRIVRAVPGATLAASTNPCLDILVEPFGP